jgi:hypothetical protein
MSGLLCRAELASLLSLVAPNLLGALLDHAPSTLGATEACERDLPLIKQRIKLRSKGGGGKRETRGTKLDPPTPDCGRSSPSLKQYFFELTNELIEAV